MCELLFVTIVTLVFFYIPFTLSGLIPWPWWFKCKVEITDKNTAFVTDHFGRTFPVKRLGIWWHWAYPDYHNVSAYLDSRLDNYQAAKTAGLMKL